MGANIKANGSSYTASAEALHGIALTSAPYPYFPTDLQPQISALLGVSMGKSSVTEGVFENRFAYVNELRKCGFKGILRGNTLYIQGIKSYTPASLTATDLRGGAALTIAALVSAGESQIYGTELIERGYSDFVGKLQRLGADIKKS